MKLQDIKKANINNWYDKPPKIIANLGDALQGIAVFVLGYVSLGNDEGLQWLAISGIIIGGLGIGIQKLFKDD